MELSKLVAALSRPSAYPHPAGDVEVHRTHISVVFLAGDYAYKVKKPIVLDFLDYGTLERRRHFCEEEVRLNRRLAPDVYLGVVPVVERDGSVVVELQGEGHGSGRGDPGREEELDPDRAPVLEWAVHMERLPDEHTLESLLRRGEAGESELGRVAAHLADFHRRAASGPEVSRYGRFEVVAGNARDNLSQSDDQIGAMIHEAVFDRLSRLLEEALEELRPLFESRAARDVPRDSHGDLRLDHVYILPDREEPTVIDCIEFNPAFRFSDPVSDMAFLAMDLEQAGRRDLSEAFADAYFRASGDEEGRRLLDFYVSYRAAVRGKVQGIKATEGDVPVAEREAAARTATGHWLLALGALAPAGERPGLVLVGGLPATGKSTLARALSREAGFEVIRSDVVRKELAGLDPATPAGAAYGEGIYAAGWSDRTYEACLERAEDVLFRGGRAVVDASFHAEERRRAFLDAAIRNGVRARFLVCEAPSEVARRRLEQRDAGPSDADREVYEGMLRRWEEPGDATRRVTTEIATEVPLAESVDRAIEALRDAGLA